MPTFQAKRGRLTNARVARLAIPAIADPELDADAERADPPPPPRLGPGADDVTEALAIDLDAEIRAAGFDGSAGSTLRVPTRGAVAADAVIIVGLGKAEKIDAEVLRKAGAAITRASGKASSVATTVHAGAPELDPEVATQALVEGIGLAAYRFTVHKTTADPHPLERVLLYAAGEAKPGAIESASTTGRVHVDATCAVRDLVNEPPGRKRPPDFASRVRDGLRGSGVRTKVLDEKALAEGGYGGMIAVGQGSDAPPRLVELRYAPKGARRHVALVGKGITFDTGGLSIKPSQGMMTMKMDMAGAATVYATVKAAAELELPVRITGVLALAENMPSDRAQRPGDIYTARGGKTVEVLNTDAEGRLVLSDALAHAAEAGPDAIVDIATLTGAVTVALGGRIGALMANDDDLAGELLTASARSGERLWRLPLPADYREDLKSEVADLKNIGKPRVAGTLIGGLFLEEFVPDGLPWAHLDVAGLAWSDEVRGYVRKGGTGAPTRTLLHWLSS